MKFPDVLKRVVVVDLETSGLCPSSCGILEISARPLDPARDELRFQAAVRFEWWMQWDAAAEKVHGISLPEASDLHREDYRSAVESFLGWLDEVFLDGIEGRAVFAGMNPSFDLEFLRTVAVGQDMGDLWRGLVSHRTIDLHSLAVARWVDEGFPESLDALHTDRIYELLGLPEEPRPHSAVVGTEMEAAALRMLLVDDWLSGSALRFKAWPSAAGGLGAASDAVAEGQSEALAG